MTQTDALTFRTMQSQADADAFRSLNEEWIERLFQLEDQDRKTLNDPYASIVARGGQVYLAVQAGQVVGCAALVPASATTYEFSKMAVSPEHRGGGIGRQLLAYVIGQARVLDAETLYLGSNRKMPNAVHLYESFGFVHVPPDQLKGLLYERCDVLMALTLER